ncbi:MAG: hypothetical protein ACUVXJ_08330 [Phycisphaerae bacterium]
MFLILVSTAFVMMGGGCAPKNSDQPSKEVFLIFHNGTGSGCLAALEWLTGMQSEHPGLVVEEYLVTDFANFLLLNQMKTFYGQSQGVSTIRGVSFTQPDAVLGLFQAHGCRGAMRLPGEFEAWLSHGDTPFDYFQLSAHHFYKGQAFSGFNDEVQNALSGLIEAAEVPA